MEYPQGEYHNPDVNLLRKNPVAEEFDIGIFKNQINNTLFYRAWKHPETTISNKKNIKKLILHVHGVSSHSEFSINVADGLVDEETVVYALDLTGHGYSDGKKGDYEKFKGFMEDYSDFVDVISKKFPNTSIISSGESMGALIVVLYMIMLHEKQNSKITITRLLFFSPAFEINREFGWSKDLGFGIKFGLNLIINDSQIIIPVDHSRTFKDKSVLKIYNQNSTILKKYSPRYLWNIFQAQRVLQKKGFSQRINVPFCIIHGTNDMLVSQKSSYRFYSQSPIKPLCLYIKVKDAWHHLFTDPQMKDEYWEKIANFLE